MTTDDDALLVDQDGGVLTLVNNDAPRNRMTLEYMDALEEAVREAAADRSVRALVFTAAVVHEVHPVDELKAAAHALAPELAAMPPRAVAGVLRCVVGAGVAPLDEALAEERRAVLDCSGTADQMEGMRAFLEKRRPVFTGE
ncbi:MAG TPA: hypothetical protein DCS55_13410 [Acidimicrobiaceae bacterium]|nr:hypothetical protein [Acidimicrobiaceae bacterium]